MFEVHVTTYISRFQGSNRIEFVFFFCLSHVTLKISTGLNKILHFVRKETRSVNTYGKNNVLNFKCNLLCFARLTLIIKGPNFYLICFIRILWRPIFTRYLDTYTSIDQQVIIHRLTSMEYIKPMCSMLKMILSIITPLDTNFKLKRIPLLLNDRTI